MNDKQYSDAENAGARSFLVERVLADEGDHAYT